MQKFKVFSFVSKLKQKRILVQFFLVFCFLITVPVAITNNINYFNSSKVIENEINQYNDQILGNMIECVDTKLWNICNSIAVISSAECFDIVFKRENSNTQIQPNKYDIVNIREQLKALKKKDIIIQEVSVYLMSDDSIVSNDGFYDFETYFKNKKCYEKISSEDWKKILQKRHTFELIGSHTLHEKTLNSDIQSNVITLLSSVPEYSAPKATVMVFINQNFINNIISEYSGIKKNDYFIMDLHGNTIAQFANNKLLKEGDISRIVEDAANSQQTIVHNGRLSITCSISPLTNWVYITVAPLKEMYKQSFYIKNTTIIVCSVCILIGLLVSVILSKKMYRPISYIVDYISKADITGNNEKMQNSKNTNEYKVIIRHLDKILEANKSLKSSLDKNIPYLSDNLFYRILHNSITSEDKVLQSMENIGVKFDKKFFVVISIKLDVFNFDDGSSCYKSDVLDISNKIIDIIINMINQMFKCYHLNEGSHTSFIVNFNPDEEDKFMDLCEEIGLFFNPDKYKQRVSIGIGVKCTKINQIYNSYNQSVKALSYINFSSENQIILFDEDIMNNFSKLFDTDIDLKPLYNSLLAGEFEKGITLACNIIDDFAGKRFPYEQMNKIAIQIIHTAVSVLDIKGYSLADTQLDKNYIYRQVESFVLMDEYKQHITDIFKCIGELVNSRYNKRKGEIVSYITKYVNEYYYKDLCLDSIADELGMSTNYLSHFFKEITGVSFPDYLGRVRVEEAKKQLETTDKPIGEISVTVGYMNINTFIRLFKKVEGITPGRYREALTRADDGQ